MQVGEIRIIIDTIVKRKKNLVGHVMRGNVLIERRGRKNCWVREVGGGHA